MSTTLPEFSALQLRLHANLSPRRYAHSLATAATAWDLAQHHGGDSRQAYLAGLLHDCSRDLTPGELRGMLDACRVEDEELRKFPELWHEPVGACLAARDYGVDDPEILRAIARHATGGPGMSLLERILYIADFAEPTRTHPEAGVVRELASRDLEAAMAMVVREKIGYLRARGAAIHSATLALARAYGIPDG